MDKFNARNLSVIITLTILGVSCGTAPDSNTSFYFLEPTGGQEIVFNDLYMEEIKLESIESSYLGLISIINDSIHFLDERFGWAFVFDADGKFHDRRLGQGHGPSELPATGTQFYTQTPDGRHVFIGSSFDVNVFDPNYQRLNSTRIGWKMDKPIEYLLRNPTPEDHRSYELAYQVGRIRADENHVYLPLFSTAPVYSDYNLSTDLFASRARILAEMNIETGEVEHIFGRLSPLFTENKNVRAFAFTHFDFYSDDKFAITFGPDSLIYVFDKDFRHIKSFGVAGRGMNVDYQEFPRNSSPNQMRDYFITEMTNRGYYTSLSCFPEHELCFRGYTRGTGSATDGLQVYRGNNLIADVDVPRKGDPQMFNFFNVEGVIDSWFYSNVFIDDFAEEMIVYRFKIEQ